MTLPNVPPSRRLTIHVLHWICFTKMSFLLKREVFGWDRNGGKRDIPIKFGRHKLFKKKIPAGERIANVKN